MRAGPDGLYIEKCRRDELHMSEEFNTRSLLLIYASVVSSQHHRDSEGGEDILYVEHDGLHRLMQTLPLPLPSSVQLLSSNAFLRSSHYLCFW